MVVQVHGFVNEKYELLIVNDTNQTYGKSVFFSYKQIVDLFSISAHAIVFLTNISSIIYDEVKLILTSSSIIIILVPNKESQAHLELHKALTTRTSFRTNLEIYKLFFSLEQFLIMCVYNSFKLFISFYIYVNAFITVCVVFV
jgi:hypothetical protein